VIWPVGMRGTSDRPFTFPAGITEDQRAATFREVIGEQVRMVKEVLPKEPPPVFHFTMYSEMLPAYQRDPAAFDLPADVIIVWPDDNDGHMRGLPASLGKWKHGVYYHLAYLGGRLTKQLTHTVGPQVVAGEFEKIVKAGATEYMLVNMSEVRDYVMGGRMLADITWDAPAIFSAPDPAARYTDWWSREYFGGSATDAYKQYFALLDTPDKLWTAPDAIQELLDRLRKKLAGEAAAPMDVASFQARNRQLQDALVAEALAENGLSISQQRFLSVDVALGLQVAQRQTQAALKLNDALLAPDRVRMWQLVKEARTSLEQLEVELERAEYPPFDRWYHESWIRTTLSVNNPHRPYIQLRAFLSAVR
jgi:hypothetical protein